MLHLVKATREGLEGRTTASGLVINKDRKRFTADDWFVALPSRKALSRMVRIINPANALEATAPVLDVGPWEIEDDKYVFGTARPRAELGRDSRGRRTNGAGIDLSEGVWGALQMADNTDVLWEFVS